MNRWSKYGGIMPETLNISSYEIINGESYNNDGAAITAATYRRVDNFIKISKGNYIFKLIVSEETTSKTLNFRIIKYDENYDNPEMVYRAAQTDQPMDRLNAIYKFNFSADEDMIIRISYRNNVQLLEIEKL